MYVYLNNLNQNKKSMKHTYKMQDIFSLQLHPHNYILELTMLILGIHLFLVIFGFFVNLKVVGRVVLAIEILSAIDVLLGLDDFMFTLYSLSLV